MLPDLTSERDRMVDSQIAGRRMADRHVLDAMRRVPRERDVAPGFEGAAPSPSCLCLVRGDCAVISLPNERREGVSETHPFGL